MGTGAEHGVHCGAACSYLWRWTSYRYLCSVILVTQSMKITPPYLNVASPTVVNNVGGLLGSRFVRGLFSSCILNDFVPLLFVVNLHAAKVTMNDGYRYGVLRRYSAFYQLRERIATVVRTVTPPFPPKSNIRSATLGLRPADLEARR